MAEKRQQQTILGSDAPLSEEISQIDSLENVLCGKDINVVSSSDILQQALHETEEFTNVSTFNNTQNSVLHESIHPLSDHSYINSCNSDNLMSSCDAKSQNADSNENSSNLENECKEKELPCISIANTLIPDLNPSQILETTSFSGVTDKILLTDNVLSFGSASDSSNIDIFANNTSAVSSQNSTNKVATCDSTVIESPVKDSFSPSKTEPVPISLLNSPISTLPNISAIKVPVKQTSAPLGSVENPIQIIQNGNSYHATQVLTQEQLQQISHVLHRQQAKKILESKGKSVLYDPSTNTRIVCRIVHPTEIQSQSSLNTSIKPKEIPIRGSSSFRGRGRPRKIVQVRKSKEEEKTDISLTKEEIEEKKKHRPRTRSGRISKPPSYMVKDYKRIHHLDFNEEPHDASDGGYSDYHVSDEEGERRASKSNSLPPGVTTAKRRNYSCKSCSKAYIGKGGLSRHYRSHPGHGKIPEGEDGSTQDENSNSSLASSVLSNSGCNTNSQTFSGSINSQASNSSSSNQTPSFVHQTDTRPIVCEGISPVQPTTPTSSSVASNRRKARLREVLKNYPEEEVLEVLLPKFAEEVSLWDFFVAKCNKDSVGLSIFEMLKEFEKFISSMQTECLNCLSPVSLQDAQGKTVINISSKQIGAALSLETGPYEIKSMDQTKPGTQSASAKDFQLHSNPCDILGLTESTPLYKRKRLDTVVEDITSGLPDQILSDVLPDNDGFHLISKEDNLSNSADLQAHNVHILNSSMCSDSPDIVNKGLFDLNSSTIVTPSSLSSGCLSAVNASRTSPSDLLNTRTPSKMPNIQMRKIQLFSSPTQPLLPQNDTTISVPVCDLSVSADCNMTDLSSTSQIISEESVIVQKQIDMCSSSTIPTKTFQGLPLDSGVDIFSSAMQELPAQAVVSDCNTEPNSVVPSVSLINTANIQNQNVPNDTIQTASVQTELADSIASCLPETHIASSLENSSGIVSARLQALVPSEMDLNASVSDAPREFETTHNVISDVTKHPESSAFLSHVMLPDGQIFSIWSSMDNNEKVQNEQFVQSYVPGNLIILQNPDGSIQVPSNQGVPAQTLQAIASLNQGLGSENGTNAFTSVRPL